MRSRATAVLPPSKLRERRTKARSVRRILWIGFLLLVLIGGIASFYIPGLLIRDVTVEGAETIPMGEVEAQVQQTLVGRRFLVLPKRNALIYPKAQVRGDLQASYPKLRDIDISLTNLHTLNISVSERKPHALWCGGEMATTSSVCYFVDDSGFAYEEAPTFSDNPYIVWYEGGLSESGVASGMQLLDAEAFKSLSALARAFKEESITARSVTLDIAGDVRVRSDGFDVLFARAQKPEDVMASLHAARESDTLKGKDLSELEYLDLRFGNRLYYKFD